MNYGWVRSRRQPSCVQSVHGTALCKSCAGGHGLHKHCEQSGVHKGTEQQLALIQKAMPLQ